MEFKQAVGTRRTIRYYQPWRPVEKSKVQKVLEAARRQSQHGNVRGIRKAVVITRGETPDDIREALIGAMYNQPQTTQAPVHIVWTVDLAGWDDMRDILRNLLDIGAVGSSYGWSYEFIDQVPLKNADFNVMVGDRTFAEWLSAFECGLAVGSALLAAVDEGLGTGLVTGRRDEIKKILNMPDTATPTQIQLLGYPAEGPEAGGQRPVPDFNSIYFDGTWGTGLKEDPKVTAELQEEGEIQAQAPLPWRMAELRALAGLYGLPD